MTFLLDTNVASEPTARTPNANVLAWLMARSSEELFLSAVTVAEIRYGIEACPEGARKQALSRWFAETVIANSENVLPIGLDVAEAWGRLRRKAEVEKRSMPIIDAFIAATAETYGLTLVTRNTRDFEAWGGPVFNPWTEPPPARSA